MNESTSVDCNSTIVNGSKLSWSSCYDNKTTVVKSLVAVSWSGAVWSAIQWLIFAVGTAGNLFILLVLICHRWRGQLVMHIFIGSLSLSALGLMLSSGWVQALYYIENNWKFGKQACQVQYFWQSESFHCHSWNLAAIAFERSVVIFCHCEWFRDRVLRNISPYSIVCIAASPTSSA
jgi:hypothetical protein